MNKIERLREALFQLVETIKDERNERGGH